MQREPVSIDAIRSDSGGYASSNASSSTSSVENSPTFPKKRWPSVHGEPETVAEADDLASYFTALTEAAVQQLHVNLNDDFPHVNGDITPPPRKPPYRRSETPASLISDPEHIASVEERLMSLEAIADINFDLNRRVRVKSPSGQAFSSVVCPFDDRVHYMPQVELSELTTDQLSESDIVFSKEYAQLSVICRVLSMALDPDVPLLDRFKFVCLVSFYLDEHFAKRLGHIPKLDPRDLESATINLRRQVRPPTKYEEELAVALRTVVDMQNFCLTSQLLPKLRTLSVEIVEGEDLTDAESTRMTAYFKEHLRPALTPILLDPTHPFPLIQSHEIYLYVILHNAKSRSKRRVIFRIPGSERLIPLDDSRLRFVTSEDVCVANLGILCHSMTVVSSHVFRVTRNTKISIDDAAFGDSDNLLDFVIEEVHRRRQAPATRLEVLKVAPEKMVTHLKNELHLDDSDVYVVDSRILDLSSCMSLAFVPLPWLRQTMRDPVVPAPFKGLTDRLRTAPGAIFDVIGERDVLVEYPRDNFENSAILYLHAAARDPMVRTIKTVIYRGGSDSPIIAALIRAAKNGKEVSVVVELKASLDEVQNTEYARSLQLAGCNVTYGVLGLKVHSKIMLVVRQEYDGTLMSYVNVSTGNFNAKTAKLYTDCSLFTCRKDICTDVLDVFNSLTGYSWKPEFRTLLVAPINMQRRFIELIQDEAANARAGKPARIACQMNGLSDKLITKELYEASRAGVRIDLIVRGPCRLRPGIRGLSDNIRVYSWIGQVLQHRRIFYFHAGGEGKYYIGSADWRTRNLTARVEVVVPIEDRKIRKRLAKAFNLINDEQWIWRMAPDGRYYKGMPARTSSPPVSVSIAPTRVPAEEKPVPEIASFDEDTQQFRTTYTAPSRSSPHQALLDVMFDDKEQSAELIRKKKLPKAISDSATDEDSGTVKRTKPKFQVDIKGNKKVVDKIAVGAVPIRFAGGIESVKTLEVLMVARRVDDPWAVPKGGTIEGESVQQATIRIAREKAGVSSCEEVANLGWIVVSKKLKQVAVQTFVLMAKELGTFASSSKERRRKWVPIEDSLQLLKTKPHEYSQGAIERALAYYRHSFCASDNAMTPLTRSVGGSMPTSPHRSGSGVKELSPTRDSLPEEHNGGEEVPEDFGLTPYTSRQEDRGGHANGSTDGHSFDA